MAAAAEPRVVSPRTAAVKIGIIAMVFEAIERWTATVAIMAAEPFLPMYID
jgi:hypothetical protein